MILKTSVEGIDKIVKRLDNIREQFTPAVEAGMRAAGEAATQVMEQRVVEAITRTGEQRVARGGKYAGRIRTGALIRSLRDQDGFPGMMGRTSRGLVQFEVGFVNNPPEYAGEQNVEQYSLSGALMAHQAGYSTFRDEMVPAVQATLDALVRDSAHGNAKPAVLSPNKWAG